MNPDPLPAVTPDALYARAPWWKTTLAPLLLLLICPPLVPVIWVIVTYFDGSIQRASSTSSVRFILENLPAPSLGAVAVIVVFAIFELALLFLLPGGRMLGPTTPAGNRPSYRLNGVAAYLITHATFAGCAYFGLFSASIVYDRFGAILSTLCIFALVFCLVLYFKGRFRPTNTDRTVTGNFIFDYFQGTELHPRLFGV
ncbi:MAG: 7-dehydrocholesterol reductase, partial [Polyangia bacterium]